MVDEERADRLLAGGYVVMPGVLSDVALDRTHEALDALLASRDFVARDGNGIYDRLLDQDQNRAAVLRGLVRHPAVDGVLKRRTHLETPVGCDILFLGNNQEQESCALVN